MSVKVLQTRRDPVHIKCCRKYTDTFQLKKQQMKAEQIVCYGQKLENQNVCKIVLYGNNDTRGDCRVRIGVTNMC